ncbi:MAG: hypothetical protein AB7F31_01215 [Parachlamydiales bacterium]
MDQIDFAARPDPIIHSAKGPFRALSGLVPFLLMGRPIARPVSLACSAYQLGLGAYRLYSGEFQEGALLLSHTTAHVTLSLFRPALVPIYQALAQIAFDLYEGQDLKAAARAANQVLFIASLFFKRPEVVAASLFTQSLTEFQEASEAEERVQALSKVGLALMRLVGAAFQLREGWQTPPPLPIDLPPAIDLRAQLWEEIQGMKTGLTRSEFDAILDYSESHAVLEATRIKGSLEALPRSITLTPEGLYIHLKTKGGIEPLGSGAFKRAYVCLKIENGHAKRMAELTVRHHVDMALAEDALAKSIRSAHIAGGAELSLQYSHQYYGQKLCLIEELMDTDGWHYYEWPSSTAADRLHVMEGVSLGLGDLHRAGYSHGDLHLGNMLVRADGLHTGKLSDLGLAHPLPTWDNFPERSDLRNLAYNIREICKPVFATYGDEPAVAALRARCWACATDPHASLPTAYEWAKELERTRLALGDLAHQPLPPIDLWQPTETLTSPVNFGSSTIRKFLSRLGFHFNTLPGPSTLYYLPITTSDVMRALGWPWNTTTYSLQAA